ncbi:TetR/AcrR family transcriptional regulator [Plantactinospora sp. S1510]|uniref:TetR/AcrR family transcriptional regulator n=2 Tax=Plantactinospora alkalitolerans TaxID=2789879 RepID=A0ABS0H3F0_9ACTN|nr:TetR/AcrR family transcriptional regulator [Plantactinospora alkalitolerans]
MVDGTRTRLVACALRMLADEGVEALTLRAIARKAQITHNAPLRHFPNRAALLSAVATAGFDDLAGRLRGAAASPGLVGSPARRLEATAHAYVAFAVANPGMFALMFRHDLVDTAEPVLAAASLAVFDEMAILVADRQHEGWHPHLDNRQLTGALWSALHGFAQLWIYQALPTATGAPPFADALHTMLRVLDLRPSQ